MIEARQLTKRYGEKTAVDGLDFTVKPGTVDRASSGPTARASPRRCG